MLDGFKNFWAQPWKGAQEMSVTDWFLFFGMIVTVSIAWRLIFAHIEIPS